LKIVNRGNTLKTIHSLSYHMTEKLGVRRYWPRRGRIARIWKDRHRSIWTKLRRRYAWVVFFIIIAPLSHVYWPA